MKEEEPEAGQEQSREADAGARSDHEQSAPGHNFFAQLRERKVVRVAIAYIVAAWALMQVAELVLSALGYPEWTIKVAVVALIVGAPVAVIGAWLYELTPRGIRRDRRDLSKVPRLRSEQRAADVLVITLLVVVAGVIGYTSIPALLSGDPEPVQDQASTVRPALRLNSIAVLAFDNLSPHPDMAYFGDGLAEEVLQMLAKLREFQVAARAASFYFKDKDVPISEVAEALQVKYLLAGSVRRSGQQVRVSTQLIDAETGFEVWSNIYDRPFSDVFEVQREIALSVAQESKTVLSPESQDLLQRSPTTNLDAYDYYLQGRDYLRRPRSVESLENARSVFRKALGLDSTYALALAGLCEVDLNLYQLTKATEHVPVARLSCERALAQDESLSAVHAALGELNRQTGELESAEAYFRTALARDPGSIEAIAGLARVAIELNRPDEAQTLLLQMIELQPGYWHGYNALGTFLYRQGRDEEAIPYYRRVTDLTPDNALGWNNLGAAQYMTGNLEGAATAWRRAIEIAPSQHMYTNLGTMYYYLSRFDEAVEMQRQAIELAPEDFRVWGRLAAAYGQQSGKENEATDTYRRAIDLAEAVLDVNAEHPDALKNVGLFYAHIGETGKALDTTERSLSVTPADPDTHFFAALVFCAVDRRSACIEQLSLAVDLGYPVYLIEAEPAFAGLRDLDEFRAILAPRDS